MDSIAELSGNAQRARWMEILAKADRPQIEKLWKEHRRPPSFVWLKKPQSGLVMIRARAGGTGKQFNFGEMTVTRCVIQLDDGRIGYAYVQGRDYRHAEMAAVLDALLQSDLERPNLVAGVLDPLATQQRERAAALSRDAAKTKVDFFTVARGENPQ